MADQSEQAGGEPTADDRDLLDDAQRLIAALEAHPDRAVGVHVTTLLQGIDTIHRTALTRLVGAIQAMAGEAFMNRLTADPAIRLLLTSYDLLAVDRRLLAEEALDTVRGHLHAHGVDVELTDVVGGAVYVKLHGLGADGIEAIRRDLEEALRAGLVGFQELVLGDRPSAPPAPVLLQVGGLRPVHRPVYRHACAATEVPDGAMKTVEIDGQAVIVANVHGSFHAVADRCGDTPLPLRFGTLQGAELRCSWHGCRYDVRTGHRVDGGPERLAVLPVAVENDEIRVAVDVEPVTNP